MSSLQHQTDQKSDHSKEGLLSESWVYTYVCENVSWMIICSDCGRLVGWLVFNITLIKSRHGFWSKHTSRNIYWVTTREKINIPNYTVNSNQKHGMTEEHQTVWSAVRWCWAGDRLRVVARRSDGSHLLQGQFRAGRLSRRAAVLVLDAQPRRLSRHVWHLDAGWSEGLYQPSWQVISVAEVNFG